MHTNTATKTFVKTVATKDRATFELLLDAAAEYNDVPKNERKAWRENVVCSVSTTMTQDSLSKRLGEALKILETCGFDRKVVDSKVDTFNTERHERGGVFTFSEQFLASWIVNGKIHGADTVGKRTHGKAETPSKAETVETVESDTVETTEIKGDKVAAVAAILQSMGLDDLTLVAHMVESRIDQVTQAAVTV